MVVVPPLPDSLVEAVLGESAFADTASIATHDVTGEALDLFGDSVGASADPADDDEPSWDIDVQSYETRRRVQYYVRRFGGSGRDEFALWLARGGRYEPMIRAKLHAAGLPEDMTYLALIESGYDPDAYSSAAAVGMWQFMTSTARGMGLRVDWWVDERRDPVRSTDAAVAFLKSLDDQFGSLYLAAAAYNGGPGRVSRGLTRYADDLDGVAADDVFFALADKNYLLAETRDYVPRLIAAALVAKDPTRYGFQITYEPPLQYDSVRVGPFTPLAAVAQAARTTTAEVTALNPAVLRGVTPPSDSFTVRVPVGHAEGFAEAYGALPARERRAFRTVRTRKNETMAALARRGGLTVHQLSWFNPQLRSTRRGRLYSGQSVRLPSLAVLSAARNVPDPSIERYGSSRGHTVTHVVRHGESLWSIARKYHTSVKSIERLNGFRKSIIFPGQIIVVRGTSGRTHVVKSGETLTSIARRYDTTPKRLEHLNGLHSDRIFAGQKLRVR
ncbi:MAG TPA: LysM peptidoglycan-binding domain-containing protein [Gemmatimonadaceae bacterium]|nr:LysM peptidoglycan-binding domain-containing protein [Gemmatimonadaceae bacterium]